MFALQKYIKKKKGELEILQEKKKEMDKFSKLVPKFSLPQQQQY